jgi:hypothetical protein
MPHFGTHFKVSLAIIPGFINSCSQLIHFVDGPISWHHVDASDWIRRMNPAIVSTDTRHLQLEAEIPCCIDSEEQNLLQLQVQLGEIENVNVILYTDSHSGVPLMDPDPRQLG